ncbi:MAG TPA: tetratricopeptide repeat protein [Polyangiaceae bacterium]|nr:tetratricopeptide repeat protein [Polyangiaceae bacterium]
MIVELWRTPSWALRALGVRLWLGLSAFACVSGAAGSVSAQLASESATAQALFDHAKALMRDGKYAEACATLEESRRIESRSGTSLNLADCYEHSGRLASAWSTFVEAAALARAAGDKERESGARERAAGLAPRLSNLVIEVPFAESTPGLEITRDDQLVGSAQWKLPLPADSGPHLISATAPGRQRWQAQVIVQDDGSTVSVVVPDLDPTAPQPVVRPDSAAPAAIVAPGSAAAPAATHDRSRMSTGVITAGVVTGVLAAGTVVTGILYGVKLHDYHTANDQLAPNRDELHSQTVSLGVANLALLGGTAVAAGVTVFLWTRAPSQHEKATSTLELRGVAGPALTGLTLGGAL